MAGGLAVLLYVIMFLSMTSSIVVVFKLYMSEKNYLIAVLSAATALIDLVVLLGVVWINDFENSVPKGFCIFQGIAIQYCAYLQMMSALCFSVHIYQLLVRKKQKVSQILQKAYIYSIIFVPIIMTIIVAVVSVKNDAIQPFTLCCDIKNPTWVKLLGYSGLNLILTFFGVYFSASAAYKVFRHLDQFKSQLTESFGNISNSNVDLTVQRNLSSEIVSSEIKESNENGIKVERSRKLKKSYNMTKAAAIRMVLFSLGYALINILASSHTVLLVLRGDDDNSKGLRGSDFAVAFTGMIIYLVFGLPQLIKRFSC